MAFYQNCEHLKLFRQLSWSPKNAQTSQKWPKAGRPRYWVSIMWQKFKFWAGPLAQRENVSNPFSRCSTFFFNFQCRRRRVQTCLFKKTHWPKSELSNRKLNFESLIWQKLLNDRTSWKLGHHICRPADGHFVTLIAMPDIRYHRSLEYMFKRLE